MGATVVSIFPFTTVEEKPGIVPSVFTLEGCEDESKPTILIVQNGSTHEWIDVTRGVRVQPVPASELARAICDDKRKDMFGMNADREAYPGLAWFSYEMSILEFKSKHADTHNRIKREQSNWYKHLVSIADDDWARYHQHRFINDLQRYACDKLGLLRDWNTKYEDSAEQCPACFSRIHPKAVVCKNCRIILKPEEYKKFQIASQ